MAAVPVSAIGFALEKVQEEIAAAALRAGRRPQDVTLVAVSKQSAVSQMREAMAFGQRDFGENRVQEAAAKYKELGTAVTWHFVGRLQGNKIRHLVGWVDLIHSLDRSELASEIDRRGVRNVEVLVEVNVSGEPSKGGVQPGEVLALLEATAALPHVRVAGLMGMAPVVASPEEARPYFRRLAALRDEVAREFPADRGAHVQHLSMGMSQDYVIAVEEGATLVRIGEAIFGRRSTRPRDKDPLGSGTGSAGTMRGR